MKVCIWGNVASSLEGNTAGGGELQIDLLSRVLARAGHEVVIIDPFSNKEFVTEEGIRVITVKNWNNGFKSFRLFTHQLPGLYKTLLDQKADIYYSQIRDFRHYLSLKAAQKVGGKFVIQLASDLDCSNAKLRFKHDYLTSFEGPFWFIRVLLNEILFPKVIQQADYVLAQHDGQKATLAKKGIESEIFDNLIDIESMPTLAKTENSSFCYVGALDRRKGFAKFYDLAVQCPSANFKVIGAPRDSTGYKYFEKTKRLKNVTLYGKLSHKETIQEIQNSKALVSTSPMEGFPNVFIEAWNYGLPVLSLHFDPGETIKKENLGSISNGSIEELANTINNFRIPSDFSERAKTYVQKKHVLNQEKKAQILTLFNTIFKSKIKSKKKLKWSFFLFLLTASQKIMITKFVMYENLAF